MLILIAARIILSGMFALAVITKLRDGDGRRRAVTAFGVPAAIATPVGWALLSAEAAIVVSLVFTSTAGAGAAVAVGLLAAFSAAIALSLARGRTPDCHCFGRLSSGPVGWPNMARNATFATLAVLIAAGGRYGWLLGIIGVTLVGLWVGPTWKRQWAQRFGAPAPNFSLAEPHGQSVTLDALVDRGLPVALVFAQAGCAACDALLPAVAGWQHQLADRVTVALVNGGSADHSHHTAHQHHVAPVLVDDQRTVLAAYGVTATPSAVMIDPRKTLMGPAAQGAKEIHELITRTATETEKTTDLSRRRVLGRTVVGFAAITVLPAMSAVVAACSPAKKPAAAPTTAADQNALEVDGAWLCNQTFALCTTAPCEPSKTDPGISVCHCVVENGYSIGFKSCTDRAQSGTKLVSDFSTINVNPAFAVLSCPTGVPWANCLDMPCEIDPTNPALATCQCQTVTTGESLTFGGGCEPATCTSTIWSAATPDLPGSAQYKKGMKQLNQPVTFPTNCPTTGTTTSATPTATPTK